MADMKTIEQVVRAYNDGTQVKIIEVLEKGDNIFVRIGTPGEYDHGYLRLDTSHKEVSPCNIFDYFSSSKDMDNYVVYPT